MNVPITLMPPALLTAAQALAEREWELAAAEASLRAAEQAVPAAHQRDVAAVAAARELGEPDPPARHEDEARAELANVQRERDIMAERVAQLRADYERLAQEQRPRWQSTVEREWKKLDAQQLRRVQELSAGFDRRSELAGVWLHLDAVAHGEDAERAARKAAAPAARLSPDLGEIVATVENGAAEAVMERTARERMERLEHEEAARADQERQVEEARRAQEAERERVHTRMAALRPEG